MKGCFYSVPFGINICKLVAALTLLTNASLSAAALTIAEAQHLAVSSDAGISLILNNSKAARAEALAKGQLPDPILIVGTQNVPTDTFKFDQEPMTQLKVGVKQMFPQGDTLAINEEKSNVQAAFLEDNAKTRHLQISRQVRNLWLDIYYWEKETGILKQDERLFQQLLEVTRSLYGVGNVQQQDVLRAELELSRLQEKIIKAERQNETQRANLSRWIGFAATNVDWPKSLPILRTPQPNGVNLLKLSASAYSRSRSDPNESQQIIADALKPHPVFSALEKQINIADKDIHLSEQNYKPSWAVELSYGYRNGQNNDGSDRSDFIGAMVNVSLPLFTSNRQDKSAQGAVYRREAQKNSYQDTLLQMVGEVQAILRKLQQSEDQLSLFDENILTKAKLHAEASLNAYQANATDFSEVMRAYISEQGDRLAYARLQINRLQLISELQFYFPGSLPNMSQLEQATAQLNQFNSSIFQGDSQP